MPHSSLAQQLKDEQRKLEKICANVFLVSGILMSIASLVDSNAGLFTAWDNYGTAITSPLLALTGLLIYLRRQWLFSAILLSVIPAMIYQQGVMAVAVHFPGKASLYSVTSSGPFLPLLYVILFISLPRGAATLSWIQCAGYYLQYALNITVFADASPSPERTQAEHLLIEVMTSHPIYVVALSYIVRLRERLHSAQQEAFEHRESLMSMVSHEIRNQLQTMLGAIEILELKLKRTEEIRPLILLERAATQLQTYLRDIKELTLLDNPQARIEKNRFDLSRLLEDIRDEWTPIAQSKGLRISLEAQSPFMVTTDEIRLRQILSNLVSNAVKYTATGSIELRASQDEAQVLIDVIDTGIGIEEKYLNQIFEPHVRLENARACCEEGSGLGLCIVERLADSIGAALSVSSQKGKGSCFRVLLGSSA